MRQVAGRTGPHWARAIVKAIPVTTLRQINKVLGVNFVTKYGSKQGVLVLGKQLPLGIGAVIGGAGNAAFAQFTIRSAKHAFGPPPTAWPGNLDQPSDPPGGPDATATVPADVELVLDNAGTALEDAGASAEPTPGH